eukprot:TRINITY_DN18546_c0_g1_i1.p1 TRINITY_DN18546_c0_g1~~TRINITY_DN18546_c0_g1_i1.p1  ORF type:complete len:315 (+),score=65.67 TRINITY_DN18546_c0_g1_i1:79-1023(+)
MSATSAKEPSDGDGDVNAHGSCALQGPSPAQPEAAELGLAGVNDESSSTASSDGSYTPPCRNDALTQQELAQMKEIKAAALKAFTEYGDGAMHGSKKPPWNSMRLTREEQGTLEHMFSAATKQERHQRPTFASISSQSQLYELGERLAAFLEECDSSDCSVTSHGSYESPCRNPSLTQREAAELRKMQAAAQEASVLCGNASTSNMSAGHGLEESSAKVSSADPDKDNMDALSRPAAFSVPMGQQRTKGSSSGSSSGKAPSSDVHRSSNSKSNTSSSHPTGGSSSRGGSDDGVVEAAFTEDHNESVSSVTSHEA